MGFFADGVAQQCAPEVRSWAFALGGTASRGFRTPRHDRARWGPFISSLLCTLPTIARAWFLNSPYHGIVELSLAALCLGVVLAFRREFSTKR